MSHILKETPGFFHKVPTGHLAEHILKELSMYLLVTRWLNCLRNHNVITMETLGKWGSSPSDSRLDKTLATVDWVNIWDCRLGTVAADTKINKTISISISMF